jgi:hypothetical protein
MKLWEVLNGPVFIDKKEVVYLDKKQAEIRAHNLKEINSGCYEVLHPICFKSGEKVGFKESPHKKILKAFEKKDIKHADLGNKNKGQKQQISAGIAGSVR